MNEDTPWWANRYLALYLAIYAALLFAWHFHDGADVTSPLLVLAILGVGFSGMARFTTRRAAPLPYAVRQPSSESLALLMYVAGLAALLVWGFGVDRFVHTEPWKSVGVLAVKLFVFVFLPGAILSVISGYRPLDLVGEIRGWRQHQWPMIWMCVALIAFQCTMGRGFIDLRHAGFPVWKVIVGVPLAFLWLALEVGLVEEFFFRVLLQSRLAAWTKSETAGIVLMALLFGLAHAPGLYLRTGQTQEGLGAHPSLLAAVAYSVVYTSVAGLFLGVLWARTRNLILLVAVHAAGDLVPNLAQFIKAWL
jgi:membrane protease YdiL (CAAX protease family)